MVQHADAQPSGRARPPTEATLAFREAMTQLQLGINIPYTGDADRDFAALLAAHARSMQAMAAIQRQYGADPKMRELAETARAQAERDLAAATAWQASRKEP
ncbi:MAG: hypothetical protein ABW026_14400 [Microvirga sp.]